MSNTYIVKPDSSAALATDLEDLADQAKDFIKASKSKATRTAYRSDFDAFTSWCREHVLVSIPARPETVAMYAAHMAREGLGVSSVQRAMAAISQAHRMAGIESPTQASVVRETVRGIRRSLGVKPNKKAPVTIDELRKMVATRPQTLLGLRDRALLLLGFSGAFRRSELAALDHADLDFVAEGVVVTVRRSKTDQEGEGLEKAIPYAMDQTMCPVLTLQSWLDAAGTSDGPVFPSIDRGDNLSGRMSDRAVARTVQRAARRVGLDPSRFAGHSLRAGFATSAILAGKSEADTMRQTGHRSIAVFRGYVRVANLWKSNASKLL